jgi:hypothetical protein
MSTTMTTEIVDKKRQQLGELVGLRISPARISSFIKHWLNSSLEAKNVHFEEEIAKIKKNGCDIAKPVAPKAPEDPKSETEEQKKVRQEARKVYDNELRKYNKWASEEYVELKLLSQYCKKLDKLESLLKKPTNCDSHQYEIKCVMASLNDQPAPRKTFGIAESDDEYAQRCKEFKPRGFLAYKGNARLDTPDNILAELVRVKTTYPNVLYFLSKQDNNKEKQRFNTPAAIAIASVVETMIQQLAEHTVKATIHERNKKMQPDHCVSEGVKELSLFPLISNSEHYLAVVARQLRKQKWINERARALRRFNHGARLREARAGAAAVVKSEFTFPSFADCEVKGGHAFITDTKINKKNVAKNSYGWHDIDVDRHPVTEIDFTTYVDRVCKEVVDSFGEDADGVIVSYKLQKFFSNLVVDFIINLSWSLEIISEEIRESETINQSTVLWAVKLMLVNSYKKTSAKVVLRDDHKQLFAQTNDMIKLWKDHHATVTTKKTSTAGPEAPETSALSETPSKTPSTTKMGDFDDLEEEALDLPVPKSAHKKEAADGKKPIGNGVALRASARSTSTKH